MLAYVARRLVALVLVLWFVGSLTFVLMHAIPGSPFDDEVTRTKQRVATVEITLRRRPAGPAASWPGGYHVAHFARRVTQDADLRPTVRRR